MNRVFKRSLISALIVSAFGLTGANLAARADTLQVAAAPAEGTTPTPTIPTPRTTTTTAPAPSPSADMSAPPGAATGDTTTTTANPASPPPTPATADNSRAKQIFDQLDTNHDGVLSFEEFSRARFQ